MKYMILTVGLVLGLMLTTQAEAQVRNGCYVGLVGEIHRDSLLVSTDLFAQPGETVTLDIPDRSRLDEIGNEFDVNLDDVEPNSEVTFEVPASGDLELGLGTIDMRGEMSGLTTGCRWRVRQGSWFAGFRLQGLTGRVAGSTSQEFAVTSDDVDVVGYRFAAEITDVVTIMGTVERQVSSHWLIGAGIGAEIICGEISARVWADADYYETKTDGCGFAPAAEVMATRVGERWNAAVGVRFATYDTLSQDGSPGKINADLDTASLSASLTWNFRKPQVTPAGSYSPEAAAAEYDRVNSL